MLVSIYKTSGGDCTNGGLSSFIDRTIIKTPDQIKHDDKNTILIILPGYGDAKQLRAVPIQLYLDEVQPMFGGNFCYSSDSRFPSDAPIKIFDRVE